MFDLTAALDELTTTYPNLIARTGKQRIDHAAQIVKLCHITPTRDPHVFHVRSQSNPHGTYRVHITEKSCTCPDSGRGNICKHRLAVHLYRRLQEQPAEQIHAQIASDFGAYEAWKSARPEAVNIRFVDWEIYPFEGQVTYTHPAQGEITVKVLATEPFENIHGHIARQVIALAGRPFTCHIYTDYRTEVFSSQFEPL